MTTLPTKPSKTYTCHGQTWEDPLDWLKNREDPDVLTFLKQENERIKQELPDVDALADDVAKEIQGKIKQTDASVPYPYGDFLYYRRTEDGQNHGIYCRKPKDADKETVVLDINRLAQGHEFISVGALAMSPDHTHVAYSLDTDGSESYDVFIRELSTGHTTVTDITKTSGPLIWDETGNGLFFVRFDKTKRPDRIFHHRIGQEPKSATLVYQDDNPAVYVHMRKSKSRDHLFLASDTKVRSEIWTVPADASILKPALLCQGEDNIELSVDHHPKGFFRLTNKNASNFKLEFAKDADARQGHWQEVLPYDAARTLNHMVLFQDHLTLFERKDGLTNIRILDLASSQTHDLAFEEAAYALGLESNVELSQDHLRFTYESPLTPERTYAYRFADLTLTLLKEDEIPTPYDPSQYALERKTIPSRDGQDIPVTLAYRKDTKLDGSAPCFQYGYGAYGICKEPTFSPSAFSLMDRGFVYALAHIRGSGTKGRSWYEAGKFQHKPNSFNDFIDVAKGLIQQNYTGKGKIAAFGGSAGGLLMGAVLNQAPELWGAIVAAVPFVDVVHTMLDESLPLTVTEYDEWGDPNDPAFFEVIKSYSPYDNIQANDFPPVLATGGLNDPRVGYWEPAKWALKLRDHQKANAPIYLKTELGAGHAGPSGRYAQYKEQGFYYAFAIHALSGSLHSSPA